MDPQEDTGNTVGLLTTWKVETRVLRCGQSRQSSTYSLRQSLLEYFTISVFKLQNDRFCWYCPIKVRSPPHLYHFLIIRILYGLYLTSRELWYWQPTSTASCSLHCLLLLLLSKNSEAKYLSKFCWMGKNETRKMSRNSYKDFKSLVTHKIFNSYITIFILYCKYRPWQK